MSSTYEDKVAILAELWVDYRQDEEFVDFIEYNDLGLPLAYAIEQGIVESTQLAEGFINETFDLLIDSLEADHEKSYENLDDLFKSVDSDV